MGDLHALALSVHGDTTLIDARRRALQVMRNFAPPWWICGGWAIDIWLGRKTRPHADLEMTILHAHHQHLFRLLDGWELRLAGLGNWERWDGSELDPEIHQVWARPDRGCDGIPEDFVRDAEYLEFCFETTRGDQWLYRRDHRIGRRLLDIGSERNGAPVLNPEIVLLYKAKDPRTRDVDDFYTMIDHLPAEDRVWLRNAIATAHPTCTWFS
jgi:hypothetical protein